MRFERISFFMLLPFKLFEDPDYVSTLQIGINDDARPFAFSIDTDSKKILWSYIGRPGKCHGDGDKTGGGDDVVYPGRIWLDDKIISFWVYPDLESFKKCISSLEDKLKIKIWDNKFRLEIRTKGDKIDYLDLKDFDDYRHYYYEPSTYNCQYKIIYVDDYEKYC